MPVLVSKYTFTITPKKVPFFIKPFANVIFSKLTERLVTPRLKDSSDMVIQYSNVYGARY